MTEKVTEIGTETQNAKRVLEEARSKREKECTLKVKEICEKHNCILQANVTIAGNQIISSVSIIALPEE